MLEIRMHDLLVAHMAGLDYTGELSNDEIKEASWEYVRQSSFFKDLTIREVHAKIENIITFGEFLNG